MNTALSPTTRTRTADLLIAVLFFSAVFLYFSAPLPGVSDLWWHMKSGQLITQTRELPAEDPFSYTTPPGPDDRKSLVLKGYWLSQVTVYSIYSIAGFKGLVLFKALVFSLIFIILWRTLCLKGVGPAIALLAMAPTPLLFGSFDNLRPQIFSFLGTVLVFYCIERGLRDLKNKDSWPASLVLLPVVMLLWANLHQGFILSYGMFAIYAAVEASKYFLRRGALSKTSFGRFVFLISVSAVASLINPNHVVAVTAGLETIRNPFNKTIFENFPLWKYADASGNPHLLYAFIAVGAVASTLMAVSFRKLKPAHFLLYVSFATAALSSFRYYIFFILMAIAISGEYISMNTGRFARQLNRIAALLVVIIAAIIINSSFKEGNVLSRAPIDQNGLPVKAAEFLSDNKLPAPVFNPYIWGGYLIWKLHPEYLVFTDSRMIDFAAYGEYREAMKGDTAVLDRYGVNTVLMYSANPLSGTVHENLLLSLIRDNRWQLVYFDNVSVIFVRTGTAPSVPAMEKRYLMEMLQPSITS